MISTRGRYAIRILLDLAEHNNGTFIPMKEMADRQDISLKYIGKIMPLLKAAGLVDSTHGIGGGYKLTRDPEQYTLWEILQVAEGDLAPVSCLQKGAPVCARTAECRTLPLWVELNRRVNAAILGMRDTRLRDGERIPNIYTVAYVAADGSRRSDDPLIDRQARVPYTLASGDTISAIEACPQGGLRHYLRVVVPANGKRITGRDGVPILPAQDSGISVTAFVHLAVEGGLLYAEFVAHVLLPLREEYRIADNLRADRVLSRSWSDTLRNYVEDNLRGPWYLISAGWDALFLSSRMARSSRNADEYRFYDYGARFSVRDVAAQRKVYVREGDALVLKIRKSMQQLDATKYIKLVDKTVTEAVIGYLREQGVDTGEFEANVQNFTIGNLVLHGGQAVIGTRNTVNQANRTKEGS